MAKEPKSLFRKLTQLFRSGPIVRRKIRALDTATAMADKTKSSGTLLFQKSLSPTYASITSNAYNLNERLMRYQDFQEMEYTPEIAAALDIYADETCLTKESIISTPYGNYTIEELLKMNGVMTPLTKGCDNIPDGKFPLYCYDNVNKRITIGFGHSVRQTGKQVPVVKVLLDNGDSIRCTPNHRFMLRDGTYVEAGSLVPGTSLMPFKLSSFTKNVNDYQYVYTMDKKKTKNGWRAQHLFNVEHLVRELKEDEVVHHKDFVRTNNGIDNLEIMNAFDHSSYHASLNNVHKFGKENNRHANWMMNNNPIKIVVPGLHELTQNKHLTIKEVASRYNTTYSVLQEWVRKYGFRNWEAFKSNDRTCSEQKLDRITSSISLDEIKNLYVIGETKAQLVMKLGCTVNVLDKFLNRKLKKSWSELVTEFGGTLKSPNGGRPKGSYSRSDVTYQDICNVMTPGIYLTQNKLAKKLNTRSGVIVDRITANGFDSFSSWQKSFHNHKVVSVTSDGLDDVYDLTVDEHHNFACNGVIVHNCAQDDKGRVLHVYSDNEKIKEILEDLFYDTLNVEFNMRSWVRNLVKYGDVFIYNDVSPDHGIVNAFPIPVNEIEREENYDRDDPFAVRYRWVTMGNRTLENWEISHFRLLGNDMFLPYGSSVIEPARRIWRQLILIEDAMLVYRVVRAPERRVFYVDVANIPPENVQMYVEEQRKRLRTNQVVDNNTGRVDLRYNPMSVDEDYIIPVRGNDSGTKIDTLAGGQNTAAVEDVAYIQKKLFAALKIPRAYLGYDELLCLEGSTRIPVLGLNGVMTIADMASAFTDKDRKEDLYVYSCDDKGKIVPGKVLNAWKTKDVTELYEVTTDDAGIVRCTANHPFMLRDGSYCRADELVPGQSLMPLYRKLSTSKKQGGSDLIDGYEMILDNMTNEWKYTHKVVSDYMNSEKIDRITKQRVVHHVDFNKLNNEPSNLCEMTWYDHRKLHAHNLQYTLLDPKVIAKREPIRIAALKAPKHREKKSIQMIAQHTDQNSKMSQWVHGDKISEVSSVVMKKNWEDPAYRELKTKQNNELWTRPEYRDKLVGDNHWINRKYEEYDINWLKEFSKQNSVISIKQWRSDHVKSISHLSPVGINRVTKLLCSNGFSNWRDFASRELGIVVPLRGPARGSQQSKFSINDLKEFCVKHNVTSIGQWTKGHRNSIVSISPVSGTVIKRVLRENGFVNFNDFKKTLTYNHKVLSVNVIKLDEPIEMYDITVEGHHNFAICTSKWCDDSRQWYDDNDKKSSLCAMGAIFVHNSSKATLAQEDIRFSRTINVIQKTMLAELNKLAIIHLYANGFEDDDLQNFTLRLSNPSTVAQQQKLELWRAKFEIGGSLPENMGSNEFVQREVWGLSKEEIDQINQQRFSEKTLNAQLEAITAESVNGESGESGDMGSGGDDIFGDMGGDDSGGGEEPDAGGDSEMEDLPPEENAGEEPEEEVENDVELLTSSEDYDDDEDFALKLSFEGDGQKPIKPVSQLKHSLYNRSRKRTHGASKTHMPDFAKMTASDNKSLNDPNDTNFLKALVSNPLGETRTRSRTRSMFNGLSPDIWSTLKNMTKSEKFSAIKEIKIMSEAVDDSIFDIDIDSEDE
jgi:intein/homing endonuclease